MTWEEHKTNLIDAIQKFLEKDRFLLENGANERSIAFRLGRYLIAIYEQDNIKVDCEYNRKASNPKRQQDNKLIIPDLLVHERGNDHNNILVIEIKKLGNTSNIEDDESKLKELTDPNKDYKYSYGIHLTFDTTTIRDIDVYKDGEIEDDITNGMKQELHIE